VTAFAVHIEVFSLQLKICFVVIEVFNAGNNLKRDLTVTLPAILAKLVLVGILMTIVAVAVLNSPELLEFLTLCHFNLVALLTINLGMFSQQLKSGIGMVKF
jgi:hypothetical protein